MLTPLGLDIAVRVISCSDREHPADEILRQQLKSERGLLPEQATAISRAVFAFYRWQGWLESVNSIADKLAKAESLAAKFARTPEAFTDRELVTRAIPAWLADEVPVQPQWIRALQSEPKLWLRARGGQGRALLAKLGPGRVFGPGALAGAVEYSGTSDLFRTPEFHAGEFELQDISSQAVGLICAPRPGETWWDACAGEGGKTLQLSDLMSNRGLIWASDRAGWRLRILRRRAARARVFNYRSAYWQGGPKLPTKTAFDGVLIDAPCSGIGTWQRNPHARWTSCLNDVKELSALQEQLLANVVPAVKPGGKLVYAVCTLTRSETECIANAFEQRFSEFAPLAVSNPLAPDKALSPRWCFWPQDVKGNGMFVAVWVKQAPSRGSKS